MLDSFELEGILRFYDITAEVAIIKHEELERADRDLSPVTWCGFRNFFVPAITALHCLSTFRCEFAKAVIDRCAGRIRKCSVSTSQETVYFFVIYIIIIESKIPTSHSVSSSTEEYHYSISFSRETSSHAQTPPHT